MKQRGHALLLIVFLIALAVGGILYYQRQVKPAPVQQAVQPSPSPKDETVNWKTYTSKYDYTLKYPSDWEVKTSDWQEGNTSQYSFDKEKYEAILRFVEPNQSPHGGFPYGAFITLLKPVDNPQNMTSLQWAKTYDPNPGDPALNIPTSTKKEISINGIRVAKVSFMFEGQNIVFYISHGQKIYEISGSFFSPDSIKYDQIFDKILPTFKFLDQK